MYMYVYMHIHRCWNSIIIDVGIYIKFADWKVKGREYWSVRVGKNPEEPTREMQTSIYIYI